MLGFVRQETTGQEWFSGETVTLCARVGVASQWARFKEGDKGDDGRLKPGLLRCVVHRLIRIQGDVFVCCVWERRQGQVSGVREAMVLILFYAPQAEWATGQRSLWHKRM